MHEPSQIDPRLRDRQRAQELLMFYDEFAEFQSSCAFFCDAVTGILQAEAEVELNTLEGIRAYSEQIKHTASGLKERLNLIREGDG